MTFYRASGFVATQFPLSAIRNGLWTAAAFAAAIACSDASKLPITAPNPALTSDALEAGGQEKISVCHMSESGGTLKDIPTPALEGHLRHGDYVAGLVVDRTAASFADGIHFARIGDALASARAGRIARGETSTALCPITISVAAGVYAGSTAESDDPSFERFPLIIDVPDLTLRGASSMPLDEKGRADGFGAAIAPENATTIVASPALKSGGVGGPTGKSAEQLLIVNAHPDGPRGDRAVIENFIFQSGNDFAGATVGGNAVLALRAQGLVIRGNQIEGGFAEPIDLREARAMIEHNYMKGRNGSCGFCLFGPGDYVVRDNKQVGPGGIPAILIFPAQLGTVPPSVEPNVLPGTAVVTATVVNNEIHNYQATPVGVAVRVGAIGVGAPDVAGTSRVVLEDNDLSHNRFAVIAEAGFPIAGTLLRGDIELTLKGNILNESCEASVLVALSRHTTALGVQTGPVLLNSTFTVNLGDNIAWADVWYSHPAGKGNTLTVDGETLENGTRAPYNSTKICPVLVP